jgi:hypothetical protein
MPASIMHLLNAYEFYCEFDYKLNSQFSLFI